jgi:hypothetical protein
VPSNLIQHINRGRHSGLEHIPFDLPRNDIGD